MYMEKQIQAAVERQVEPLIRKAAAERWRDDSWSYFREVAEEQLNQGEGCLRILHGSEGRFPSPKSELCFRSDRVGAKLNGSPSGHDLDLFERVQDICARIALAVNNSRESDDYDRSYSKSLITALFKYGGRDSALVVKKLELNTISLAVAVNGVELPHHPVISLNDVNNRAVLAEAIQRTIKEASIVLEEADQISFWFSGYTVDISWRNAKELENICYSKIYEGRKRYASYRADEEVLSDEPVSPEEKLSQVSTECVRLLALLKIFTLDQECRELYQYHLRYLVEKGLPTEAFTGVFSYMNSRLWDIRIVRSEWDDFCAKSEEKGVKYPRYDDYHNYYSSNPKEPKKVMTELLDQLFRQGILLTDEELYIYAKHLLTDPMEG